MQDDDDDVTDELKQTSQTIHDEYLNFKHSQEIKMVELTKLYRRHFQADISTKETIWDFSSLNVINSPTFHMSNEVNVLDY